MFVAGILPLLLSARRLRSCQRLEPSLAVPFRPSRLVILWYLSLGRLASGRLPFHALRMSTLKSPAMNPTPGGRVAADDGDDDNTDGVDEPCPTPTCIILDRTNPPTSTTCAIRATVSGASRFPPPPDCRCVLKRSTSQAELANRIASLCCPWTRRTRAAPRTCGEKKCSNGCVSLGSRARSHTLSLSLSLSLCHSLERDRLSSPCSPYPGPSIRICSQLTPQDALGAIRILTSCSLENHFLRVRDWVSRHCQQHSIPFRRAAGRGQGSGKSTATKRVRRMCL